MTGVAGTVWRTSVIWCLRFATVVGATDLRRHTRNQLADTFRLACNSTLEVNSLTFST